MLMQEVWGCTAQLSPTAIPCSCWVHQSWEAWVGRKEQDTPRHRFPQSCFSACSKRTDPSPLCGDCPKREVRDLLLPQGRQSRAAPPRVKTARPVPPPQLRQNAASSNLPLQLQSLPPPRCQSLQLSMQQDTGWGRARGRSPPQSPQPCSEGQPAKGCAGTAKASAPKPGTALPPPARVSQPPAPSSPFSNPALHSKHAAEPSSHPAAFGEPTWGAQCPSVSRPNPPETFPGLGAGQRLPSARPARG